MSIHAVSVMLSVGDRALDGEDEAAEDDGVGWDEDEDEGAGGGGGGDDAEARDSGCRKRVRSSLLTSEMAAWKCWCQGMSGSESVGVPTEHYLSTPISKRSGGGKNGAARGYLEQDHA